MFKHLGLALINAIEFIYEKNPRARTNVVRIYSMKESIIIQLVVHTVGIQVASNFPILRCICGKQSAFMIIRPLSSYTETVYVKHASYVKEKVSLKNVFFLILFKFFVDSTQTNGHGVFIVFICFLPYFRFER